MLIHFVFYFGNFKLSNNQEISTIHECTTHETNNTELITENLSINTQKSSEYGVTNDEINVCKKITLEDTMDWDDILSLIEEEIEKKNESDLTKSSTQTNNLHQSSHSNEKNPFVSDEDKQKKIEQIQIYLEKQCDANEQVSNKSLKFESRTNINKKIRQFYFLNKQNNCLNYAEKVGKQNKDLTCTSTQQETVMEKVGLNANQSSNSLIDVQASDQCPVTQPQSLMQTQNCKQNSSQMNLSINKEYSHIEYPYNQYENMQNSHYQHKQTFLPQSNSFTLDHSVATASYQYYDSAYYPQKNPETQLSSYFQNSYWINQQHNQQHYPLSYASEAYNSHLYHTGQLDHNPVYTGTNQRDESGACNTSQSEEVQSSSKSKHQKDNTNMYQLVQKPYTGSHSFVITSTNIDYNSFDQSGNPKMMCDVAGVNSNIESQSEINPNKKRKTFRTELITEKSTNKKFKQFKKQIFLFKESKTSRLTHLLSNKKEGNQTQKIQKIPKPIRSSKKINKSNADNKKGDQTATNESFVKVTPKLHDKQNSHFNKKLECVNEEMDRMSQKTELGITGEQKSSQSISITLQEEHNDNDQLENIKSRNSSYKSEFLSVNTDYSLAQSCSSQCITDLETELIGRGITHNEKTKKISNAIQQDLSSVSIKYRKYIVDINNILYEIDKGDIFSARIKVDLIRKFNIRIHSNKLIIQNINKDVPINEIYDSFLDHSHKVITTFFEIFNKANILIQQNEEINTLNVNLTNLHKEMQSIRAICILYNSSDYSLQTIDIFLFNKSYFILNAGTVTNVEIISSILTFNCEFKEKNMNFWKAILKKHVIINIKKNVTKEEFKKQKKIFYSKKIIRLIAKIPLVKNYSNFLNVRDTKLICMDLLKRVSYKYKQECLDVRIEASILKKGEYYLTILKFYYSFLFCLDSLCLLEFSLKSSNFIDQYLQIIKELEKTLSLNTMKREDTIILPDKFDNVKFYIEICNFLQIIIYLLERYWFLHYKIL